MAFVDRGRLGDVFKVLASAIGAHYVDKLWGMVGGVVPIPPDIGKLLMSYLVWKYGDRIHSALSDVGFGMMVVSVERLLAPYLPGSPSVFSKNEVKSDAYREALMYAGVRING